MARRCTWWAAAPAPAQTCGQQGVHTFNQLKVSSATFAKYSYKSCHGAFPNVDTLSRLCNSLQEILPAGLPSGSHSLLHRSKTSSSAGTAMPFSTHLLMNLPSESYFLLSQITQVGCTQLDCWISHALCHAPPDELALWVVLLAKSDGRVHAVVLVEEGRRAQPHPVGGVEEVVLAAATAAQQNSSNSSVSIVP